MQRKTVNLNDSLAAKVLLYFDPSTRERECLHELIDDELSSESDVLQALVDLGIRAIQERQLEEGYAALAAEEDPEREAWVKSSMEQAAKRYAEEDE